MAAIFTAPKFSSTRTASISAANTNIYTRIPHHVSSKRSLPPLPHACPRKTAVSCSHQHAPPPSSTTTKLATRNRPDYVPNRISDPNYVRIFDTTLRDGEQSPGASMTSKEKVDIARQLAKLGVDIIEAGFPASSKDDFEAVKTIAKEVGNAVDKDGYVPVICGLSRCNEKDIRTAWDAVKYAKRPRIHTFIATSPIHMEYKLRKTKEEVIDIASRMVRFARSLGCDDVEFSPEDAGRSDREFLYEILGEVIRAGATTLNIPDTVGITVPNEFGKLIADIKSNTHGIENVIISTHCQNDLGLSTANTVAGACAGARQLEVTINGIGERAGNASLEEVVMTLKCHGENFGGLYTGINPRHIYMTSKMVEEYTGMHVQPHKAIVGANAFAHESGIHQLLVEGRRSSLGWDWVVVFLRRSIISGELLIILVGSKLLFGSFLVCGGSLVTVGKVCGGRRQVLCSLGVFPAICGGCRQILCDVGCRRGVIGDVGCRRGVIGDLGSRRGVSGELGYRRFGLSAWCGERGVSGELGCRDFFLVVLLNLNC